MKPSQGGHSILIRALWYDFAKVAMPTPNTDLFNAADTQFLSAWQPLMFLLRPPAGSSWVQLYIQTQDGATAKLTHPSLR